MDGPDRWMVCAAAKYIQKYLFQMFIRHDIEDKEAGVLNNKFNELERANLVNRSQKPCWWRWRQGWERSTELLQ